MSDWKTNLRWLSRAVGELILVVSAYILLSQDSGNFARESLEAGPGQKPLPPRTLSPEAEAMRDSARRITFPAEGRELMGWIYRPEGDGPFPAVIWNHGSEKNPIRHPELAMFYVRHGYVLFLPVRHGHGQSPGDYIVDLTDDYRNRVKNRQKLDEYVVSLHELYNKDVAAAVQWLKEQPYVDRDKVVMTGVSYGGIQTVLAAEKGLGVQAFIPFAPAAMSWNNAELQKRLMFAVQNARAPVFLIQADNDYSTGPSEVLGPLIRRKAAPNRASLYPAFGTTHQDGHGAFACREEGIAIWGSDVLEFLQAVGASPASSSQ